MADIELRVVNESGELVAINLDGTADGKQVLTKEQIEALVDLKFGNYTFDGDELVVNGLNVIDAVTNNLGIGQDFEKTTLYSSEVLLNLTIAAVDLAYPKSAITKEWTLAKFFQQSQFINDFTGTAAQPILTDLSGKIASSLLPTQSAPQGNFTPTGGQEYPTLSGNVAGDYWIVNDVGAGYLFVGGDLAGETVYESAWMVLDVNLDWILSNNYSGTVQTAWGAIIGTLSDQIDLNNALSSKADQSALDTTNTNVATNADDIDANTIAINLKANQTDLDATNLEVDSKLETVATDATITGDGTLGNPLSATGGGTGESNYVNFSGSTSNTAAQNATALISDFAVADEVFIKKGVYALGDAVISQGKTLRFETGAILDVTGTLTGDNTQIKASANQIFYLTADLQGTWRATAFPEWFGAKGDGTGTQDAEAINKALQVFSVFNEVDLPGAVSLYDAVLAGNGNAVWCTGSIYNIEESIIQQRYCVLAAWQNTVFLSGDGMFDSMCKITQKPYEIFGGNWVVREYIDQSGYQAIGTPDEQDRVDWSYNKNPVFHLKMKKAESLERYQRDDYRFYSGVHTTNVRSTHSFDNADLAFIDRFYDFMTIEPDNDVITDTSTVFDRARYYYLETLEPGDDFTNLNASANASGTYFECLNAEQAATWTNGSVMRNAGNESYFSHFRDINVRWAASGVTMRGDSIAGTGGAINSYLFERIVFDVCWGNAIRLESRAVAQTFTDCIFQGRLGYDIEAIYVNTSYNRISGFLWDNNYSGAVKIEGDGVIGNDIRNLKPFARTTQTDESGVTFGGVPSLIGNNIGEHPYFVNIGSDTSEMQREGMANLLVNKIGIGFRDNPREYAWKTTTPQAVIDAMSKDQDVPIRATAFSSSISNDKVAIEAIGLCENGTSNGTGTAINFKLINGTDPDGIKGGAIALRKFTGNYNSLNMDFEVLSGGNIIKPMTLKSTGVANLTPVDTSGALPTGALGDMFVGSDGSLNMHDGSGWRTVDTTPRP